MSISSTKVKLLLIGSIDGDHVEDAIKKLTTLQKSKAGPFDACFCVGSCSPKLQEHAGGMPLPMYIQDCSRLKITEFFQYEAAEYKKNAGDKYTLADGVLELNTNLYALYGGDGTAKNPQADIYTLSIGKSEMVVASVPPHARLDSDALKALQEKLTHVSYVGCDLLLTSEFPQGIDRLLPQDTGAVAGSFDIADLALRARARYHVSPHNMFHFQSSPFTQLKSASSTFTPKHIGRFLSLAPVVAPKVAKERGKLSKFVHALGMTPLNYMTSVELEQVPDNVQPNPFTDDSYQQITKVGGETTTIPGNPGLSEAQARRLMSEDSGQDYRWNNNRKRKDGPGGNDDGEVDDSITALFVHGLHKDVSGRLQTGTVTLLQAFQPYEGLQKVRRPPAASSYAFLEFDSHQAAKNCLEKTGGVLTVAGIHLTLKWASQPGGTQVKKKQRLTEAEAINSSTLYFRLPHKILTEEMPGASEDLRKIMEKTLEDALGDPSVTAANEPALQVKHRVVDDKGYGFLDFASHAAASMAMAALTGSTDGGALTVPDTAADATPAATASIEGDKEELASEPAGKLPEHLWGVTVYWAPEKSTDAATHQMMETASGVKFERQHFPADARTDCWFCLASKTCEKHLITSVHNQCYMAMPKGPIHKEGHILLVPVTHSGQGALSDPAVMVEMDDLKKKLRQHASDVYNMDLFCFERAIQTKGGYHTHVQCVPVPKNTGARLKATLVAMARSSGFSLRELNSDLGLAAVADGDGGYFYAEVPVASASSGDFQRFLYRADSGGGTVPLQFGREVLASVLDNPDLAHWKACVLSEEEETSFAMKFRESFSKYEA
jgi:hypothetical protein